MMQDVLVTQHTIGTRVSQEQIVYEVLAPADHEERAAAQEVDYWWGAGGKDLFIVQPEDDVIAVPENAYRLCDEFGGRVSMVMVPDAGHALLPEQPDAVAVALITWLGRDR